MRVTFRQSFMLLLAVSLQGCTSFYGPVRPVQAGNLGGVRSCTSAPRGNALLEDRFVVVACASLRDPKSEEKAKDMLEAGFSLVSARCNDFFAQKNGTQLGVRTAFDAVAPVVALLTGILSITNFSNAQERKDRESVLAFGSVALMAGLKIYESNFLFSADNIENVRELTTTALNTHAQAVRKLTGHTFDTSLSYLIEHQMYCTPSKIRDLAEGAIANGRIKAVDRNTGDELASAGDPAADFAPAEAGTPIKLEHD